MKTGTARELPDGDVVNDVGALREAARIVRRRGLAKATYEDSRGRVCALEALNVAGAKPRSDLFASVRAHIGDRSITRWSDADGRTAEDVACTFEAVADGLEAS